MDIIKLMLSAETEDSEFNTKEFRDVLEDHISILRGANSTTTARVTEIEAYRREGDFYGLLSTKLVKGGLNRWIHLRANNMHNSYEYDGNMTSFILLSSSDISKIQMRHKTKKPTIQK
jgi:hypothetical protein